MLVKLTAILSIIIILMGIKCEGQGPKVPTVSETFCAEMMTFIKDYEQDKWSLVFANYTLYCRYYPDDGMTGKQVINATIYNITNDTTYWIWYLVDETKKSTWSIISYYPKVCIKPPFTKLSKVFNMNDNDYMFTGNNQYFDGKLNVDTWITKPPFFEKDQLNLTTISFEHTSQSPNTYSRFFQNSITSVEIIKFDPNRIDPDDKVFAIPDFCKEDSYKVNFNHLEGKIGVSPKLSHPFLYPFRG